jgi:uncharacterized protein (DUF952 family)
MAPRYIYKLALKDLVDALAHSGESIGSEHDRRDGFIHLSTAEQCTSTFDKYFAADLAAGRAIWLLAVDTHLLDAEALKYEAPKPIAGTSQGADPLREAQRFPHLYAPLKNDAIVQFVLLQLDSARDQIALLTAHMTD